MAETYDATPFLITDPVQQAIVARRSAALLDFNMDTAMALVEAGVREDRAIAVAVSLMLQAAACLAASVAIDYHGREPERVRWDDATGRAFESVLASITEKKAVTDAG